MSAPVRRRPGRPRKNPLPEETPSTEVKAPKKKGPSDPNDPRIGEECHPLATQVGFDDGAIYEAEDGFLVRRLEGG